MPEKKKKVITKEKTAGQIIAENTAGKQLDDATPNEITNEAFGKSFDQTFMGWIEQGKALFDNDFFIILNLKSETSLAVYTCDRTCGGLEECSGCVMIKPVHTIPEVRQTCPDPFYDQSVWRYDRANDKEEYLWTVPDIARVKQYKDFPLNCPPEEVQLRNFVLDYCDGTLQKKANQINKVILRSENGRKSKFTGNA